MKSFRAARSRIFVALAFAMFLAGSLKFSGPAAQNESSSQESIESVQITANDEIAADDIAKHHVHLQPLRAQAALRGRYEDAEVIAEICVRNHRKMNRLH